MTVTCYHFAAYKKWSYLQGACVFEKGDTVASLSAVFKSGKAAVAKAGGLPAFINQYKQVQS